MRVNTRLRELLAGHANAMASEMAPRNPPQVRTDIAPFDCAITRLSSPMIPATLNQRAASTMGYREETGKQPSTFDWQHQKLEADQGKQHGTDNFVCQTPEGNDNTQSIIEQRLTRNLHYP